MLLTLAMGFDRRLGCRMNAIMGTLFLGASLWQARAALPAIAEFAELDEYLDTPCMPIRQT